MKTNIKIFPIFIVTLILSACSGGLHTSQVDLDGSAWVLTAINNNAAIIGNPPTLEFEGNQVVGNASCNTYGGSYQVKGDAISFGPLARTEMYCMEPEGVMDQEQTYLEILEAAQRFELTENILTIYSDSGETLTFQARSSVSVATNPSSVEPSNQEPPTIIPEPVDLTPIQNINPPAGFKEYRDTVAGISIYIPENWTVTGVVDGEYAIFQSYPEDKYIGGEGREPRDTKCDLNIRPAGTHAEELVQQWQSDSMTTIVSEEDFTLQSGLVGQRFVIDSMGRATAFITELNQRVVILTCFGNFTVVDEIAGTLKTSE
jgi:heat shock protein HslJ